MGPENEIGLQINILSHMVKRTINMIAFSQSGGEQLQEVFGIQGRIMRYLYENRDRDVFQRDIQEHFSIRRSTVTGTLQLMEKNGFILRKPVEWDARLKKLELTQKALEMHQRVAQGIRRAEELLSSTLTPEEKETLLRLCRKVRDGLQEMQRAEKPQKV